MTYFSTVKTLEELKKEYRKLAKTYHPDLGGSELEMKRINNLYENLFNKLKNASNNKEDQAADVNQFKDLINKIITFDLEIEIVGTWVWVSGNTYNYKEQLKEIGFKWSSKRKKWYYAESLGKKKVRGCKLEFEAIRQRYGSNKVETKKAAAIN